MAQLPDAASKPAVADEPRWHASIAVIAALALYVTLPGRFTLGPVWVFPVLVMALLLPLSIFSPSRHQETPLQRGASIAMIAIINLFNVASVALLIYSVFFQAHVRNPATGQQLLVHGTEIWLTNILVYALWFWELDGGGPEERAHCYGAIALARVDFLFPQMLMRHGEIAAADQRWKPQFLDYAYVSFTNAVAFSPTDTMPLSATAKVLMTLSALTSLVTIAIVVARAINIVQ